MQETNLKVSPYFDDFDPSKNYQKVLFKPGYSVQTRELNQLQTVLQNQIEKFGQHFFKEGSLVIPGNVNYNLSAKAVLVQPLMNGISVESYREDLVGKKLTGSVSGVKAEVVQTISQEESEKDTITLYVQYNYGGNFEGETQLSEFKNNEILLDENNLPVAVTTVQNATAYTGSTVNINPGVYFVRGFFVEVSRQLIILDQYSNKPSYKVGLQIIESIASVDEDETLYDNSIGSTNYASPGADRLKIQLKLIKQNLLISDNSNFIELVRFEEGKITQQADAYYSAYNELEKNLARRTFDESGSYATKPYTFKIREALNDGENGGVYFPGEITYNGKTVVTEIPSGATLDPSEDSYSDANSQYILGKNYYVIELSEGKAYVQGFEVLNERKQYVVVPKPRKSKSLNNQGLSLDIGSYLKVSTVTGSVAFDDVVFLKDADNTVIGKAKVLTLTGDDRLYVTDVVVYEKLTLSAANNIAIGDFLRGSTSGATAFVEQVSSNVITLRQVTGTFVTGESIESSRYTTSTNPTISSIERNLLENVRKADKTSGFSSTISLDSVSISGSSFVVTGGTSLTGTNTSFNFELSEKSRLEFPGVSGGVEVDSITNGTSVTLSSSVTNGTYYTVSKKICKLYTSHGGLTVRTSLNPIKTDSDYLHYRSVSGSFTVGTNGDFTIQSPAGTFVDRNSLVITSATSEITNFTASTLADNSVYVTNTGVTAGTVLNAYYSLRVSNPGLRIKNKRDFRFLSVDKEKNASNNVYGTRFSDKEISLKYPDVIKVHAVHQAIKSGDSPQNLFDKIILNDASTINLGDLITAGSIKARVISKSSNTVYIKYISSSRFTSGDNLTISISVPTNTDAVGLFIKESFYGRYIDITDDFKFVRNDDKNYYNVSKLVRKSSAAAPNTNFVVVFDYFEHSNLSNDFYTVESYCPDVDAGTMAYEEIPYSFNSVPMADQIDFRYYKQPSSVSGTAGTVTSPFKETASVFDSFITTVQNSQKVPYPGSIFGLDYEFYLGRIDKVYLTASTNKYGYTTGQVRVIKGSDSIDPLLSENPEAGLLIGTITLPPYLKNVSEAQIKFEKNRNYTMRDIGKLEERLSNVEQYTSLSLLEVNTNNLNILDEEGRNRFKNGFVVDSFTTTDVADLSNPDYTASIDLDKNIVRPYPAVNNASVYYSDTESTANKLGQYVTIPYEEVPLISQIYSSRVENLFPYEVFSWIGNMEITPHKDIWYDTQRQIVEGQNIDFTDAYTALFDLVLPSGQIWGGWQNGAGGAVRGGGGTTITDIREGTQYDVGSLNFDIESGDTIQSIEDIRFSRSRIVTIGVKNLKPNTKFYFYVNDVESTDIIYPKLLTGLSDVVGNFVVGETVILYPTFDDDLIRAAAVQGLQATVIDPRLLFEEVSTTNFSSTSGYSDETTILGIDQIRSSENSDINPTLIGNEFTIIGLNSGAFARVRKKPDLISNESGTLNAFVLIPPTTFETGDLTFSISDQSENLQVKGLTGSFATGYYYSQGTELNVTSNITTLEVPELTATAITEERTRFIPDPPPRPAGHDPIAQSFFIDDRGGVFVTSIDLFFLTKDETLPVTIDVRTVENGIVTGYLVPGSVVTVESKDVKLSTDASVPTRFTFKNPLYLSSNNDYCFVVRTTNRNYNMWVSRLGEVDVTTGLFIDKQPYVGVLYKSSNQSIWTPDQYEDVKFVLNRAVFDTNTTYTAVFPNNPVPTQSLIKNPLKFTSDSSIVTVFQPNHGMHKTDNRVTFKNVASDTSNASLGAAISSTETTISLKDITGSTGVNFPLSSTEGWNKINNQVISTQNPGFVKIGDEIISYTGVSGSSITGCSRGQFGTTAVSHSTGAVVRCFQLNGIPLNQLNTTHKISKVISLDEYQIIVESSANDTKQSGGSDIRSTRNIQYETLVPNFNMFSPTDTTVDMSITSISGTSIGNALQESFVLRGPETVENNVENVLNEPKLVLSEPNKTNFQPGASGTLKTYINLSTTNDRLSPVIDIEGSSLVTISNRLNKEVDNNGDLDLSSELTPTGGKHSAYITKRVLLETSSTSVKVLFDAIRTPNNDIKVFVKIKGDSTPGSFLDMNYVEVPAISYPASENKKQFRAFDFEIKSLREFQEFSVKIVMVGNDQSDAPKIRNFRALALAL